MAIESDEPRRKSSEIRIGEELSAVSVDELRERITALEAEIVRIRNTIQGREGTRSAAENLFRK